MTVYAEKPNSTQLKSNVLSACVGVHPQFVYCNFGNFREGLFSRNFAYAKLRVNITLARRVKLFCPLLI